MVYALYMAGDFYSRFASINYFNVKLEVSFSPPVTIPSTGVAGVNPAWLSRAWPWPAKVSDACVPLVGRLSRYRPGGRDTLATENPLVCDRLQLQDMDQAASSEMGL